MGRFEAATLRKRPGIERIGRASRRRSAVEEHLQPAMCGKGHMGKLDFVHFAPRPEVSVFPYFLHHLGELAIASHFLLALPQLTVLFPLQTEHFPLQMAYPG